MFRIIPKSILVLIIMFTNVYPFQPLFDTQVNYPMMGLYITTSVKADFNNDGFVDFICGTNSYYDGSLYNQLKYYVNNGDGTFQDPVDIPAGVNHSVMAAGDFNNDGWEDFISISNYPYSPNFYIYIFMNQGDGNLVLQQFYPKVTVPYLAVMDINNDSFDDILQMDNGTINVMFSKGDGTFRYGTSGEEMVNIPMDRFGQMRSWDLNDDDYPDLLVSGNKTVTPAVGDPYSLSFVASYFNNLDTSFTLAAEYLYESTPGELIYNTNPGYFNADSYRDLLIRDNQDVYSILKGNADGSFSLSESVKLTTSFPTTRGDVNGDGLDDILISDNETAALSVLLNNGDVGITFSDPLQYSGKWADLHTPAIGAEDFNNDGYDDFYSTGYSFSTIINRGNGTFPVLQTIEDVGNEPFDMLSEDFNQDGYPDILTIDADRLYISYNDGMGGFLPSSTISSDMEWQNGIFSGDFNADEIPDFAVTKGLKLFYGLAEGGFQPGPAYGDSLVGLSAIDGTAAYLNDDEFIDFALYFFGSLRVVLSDNSGSYQLESYVFSTDGHSQITDIDVADIDNDNDLDILFGFLDGIYINYNDGEGSFNTVSILSDAGSASNLVIDDFNHDGHLDIAAAQSIAPDWALMVYLNNGNGTFASPQPYGHLSGLYYQNLTTADMDNDNDPDIVATVTGSNEIAVFFNDGGGTFPEIQYYTGGDKPIKMALANFNNDSTTDVAVLSSVLNRDLVYVFPNTGKFATSIEQTKPWAAIPGNIALEQNYPNPFNPTTVISYRLSEASQVDLSIFNILGQKVATLVSEQQTTGYYKVNWNASRFPSGMYIYQLKTNSINKSKKMLLIR